jgi:hypothetical protein
MPVEHTLIAHRVAEWVRSPKPNVRTCVPAVQCGGKYDTRVDRDSAAEMLARSRSEDHQRRGAACQTREQDDAEEGGFSQAVKDAVFGTKRRQGMVETMAKQTARTVGSQIGNKILRGVLGGILAPPLTGTYHNPTSEVHR